VTPTATRRRLLALLGAAAAATGMPAAAPARGDPRAGALLGLTRHPASAARVGAAYLATRPAEADTARLVEALWPDPDPGDDPAALARAFAARMRDDFTQGRTARVEGWVLSASEARLCALHALARPALLG
jgi:hypothetical protein